MMLDHVARSVRAEHIRTGGCSRLWTVLVPAAAVVPMLITFTIALVAESFARIPGQLGVLQVPTSNAGYWVIVIAVPLSAVAAADGQSSENSYRSAEYVRLAVLGRGAVLGGRWIFYGALGAAVAVATMFVVLAVLPVLSPSVYAAVSATDAVALRLMWSVGVLSFFAAGAGVGVGALTRSPLAATSLILIWAYVVESAAGYLPHGAFVQRFMPLLNGVYATGQDTVLVPPWSPDAALLYVCSLFTVVFLIAFIERSFRHG